MQYRTIKRLYRNYTYLVNTDVVHTAKFVVEEKNFQNIELFC